MSTNVTKRDLDLALERLVAPRQGWPDNLKLSQRLIDEIMDLAASLEKYASSEGGLTREVIQIQISMIETATNVYLNGVRTNKIRLMMSPSRPRDVDPAREAKLAEALVKDVLRLKAQIESYYLKRLK